MRLTVALPVRREQVELGELLERTQQRFSDRARQQDREIRVHAPGDAMASVDPLRARQALGNLVDNALRHGGGDVVLSARRVTDGIEVEVSDDGPGFPSEFAPRAFERFAGGGVDGQHSRSGAGLGLAIVCAIAEAHGGTAMIVDSASRGATVRLCFPSAGTTATE